MWRWREVGGNKEVERKRVSERVREGVRRERERERKKEREIVFILTCPITRRFSVLGTLRQ